MKRGDRVLFQFDDAGIPRTAVGKLESINDVGMHICSFEHSNIEVECLPFAVRPYKFSHTSLIRKINKLIAASHEFSFAGSHDPDTAEEIREEFRRIRREVRSLISFLK